MAKKWTTLALLTTLVAYMIGGRQWMLDVVIKPMRPLFRFLFIFFAAAFLTFVFLYAMWPETVLKFFK